MANQLFRVEIPLKPIELVELSERIIAKHKLDGESSLLQVFDMDEAEAITTLARSKHENGAQLNRDKELAFELRDNALGFFSKGARAVEGTVLYYLIACKKVLLGFYKGREQTLGEYGYEITERKGNISVVIPLRVVDMIDLAFLILAKHEAEGAESPLKGLNMADFKAKTEIAIEQNKLANKLNRDKEAANAERDRVMGIRKYQSLKTPGTVRFYVISIRDLLLGIFKSTESELGDWGFNVQGNKRKKDKPDAELNS